MTPDTDSRPSAADTIRTHAQVRIAQLLKLATTWQAAVMLAMHGPDASTHLCNIAGLKRKLEGLLELANLARAHYGEPPAADVEAAVDQAIRRVDDILVELTTARACQTIAAAAINRPPRPQLVGAAMANPMPWLTDAIQTIRRESRAAWLRFEISSTQAYLDDCAQDGLIHSLHLDEWRTRLAEMRVELATLAPPLPTHTHATTPNVIPLHRSES